MRFKLSSVLKPLLDSILLSTIFTSCPYKNPVTRITDFHSMISDMVDKSAIKIKRNILLGEVVLVSDYVNMDNLK
ncbi:hypothetical protein ACOL3F_12005, partial [Aliarcobacter butzleri]